MADEVTPRQEFEFSLTTSGRGKIIVKMMDRINVDDVFLHLVHEEIFHIITSEPATGEVAPLFKDALLKERFTLGQN